MKSQYINHSTIRKAFEMLDRWEEEQLQEETEQELNAEEAHNRIYSIVIKELEKENERK